jgi:hypothetical protein
MTPDADCPPPTIHEQNITPQYIVEIISPDTIHARLIEVRNDIDEHDEFLLQFIQAAAAISGENDFHVIAISRAMFRAEMLSLGRETASATSEELDRFVDKFVRHTTTFTNAVIDDRTRSAIRQSLV